MSVFKSRGRLRLLLPALCYLAAFLLWLGGGLVALGQDSRARKTGALITEALTASDFVLVDLRQEADGTFTTLSGDPQMHLEKLDGLVRTLTVDASFTKDAREMCLYYTTAQGEAFGQDKRVFPVENDAGVYTYTLPRKALVALRLDPCSPAENEMLSMTLRSITLNEPVSPLSYFIPGWHGLFLWLAVPALVAAALDLGLLCLAVLFKKRGEGETV